MQLYLFDLNRFVDCKFHQSIENNLIMADETIKKTNKKKREMGLQSGLL